MECSLILICQREKRGDVHRWLNLPTLPESVLKDSLVRFLCMSKREAQRRLTLAGGCG